MVVPWGFGFDIRSIMFFFHPKSRPRDISHWIFKKSSMEKKCADFRFKKSDTAGDWTHDQLMLNDGLWSEKALALTAEPSMLWEERCIYLISAFIFTFSSFLKKLKYLNWCISWTERLFGLKVFSDGRCADKLQETRSSLLINSARRGNIVLSEGTWASFNSPKVL